MFLELFSSDNFNFVIYRKTYPDEKYQESLEHLRQLLQTVPAGSSVLEYFKQRANKPSPRCQSKSYIAPP